MYSLKRMTEIDLKELGIPMVTPLINSLFIDLYIVTSFLLFDFHEYS